MNKLNIIIYPIDNIQWQVQAGFQSQGDFRSFTCNGAMIRFFYSIPSLANILKYSVRHTYVRHDVRHDRGL